MKAPLPTGETLKRATEAVERVASISRAFESRWSLYSLRRIDPELHETFVLQQGDWWQSLMGSATNDLMEQTDAMCRGWLAVIKRMEEAGAAEDAYMIGLHDDTVVVVGRNRAAATSELREKYGGQRTLFVSPDEVAAMVNGLGDVAMQVKEMWPGAVITRVGEKMPAPPPEETYAPPVPPAWMQRVRERDALPGALPGDENEYAPGDGDDDAPPSRSGDMA